MEDDIKLTIFLILGLIGITISISAGKLFDPLREWLKGFTFWANPLRFVGDVLGCTMCTGFWVGFFWGLYAGHRLGTCIVFGGIISVLSLVADDLLAFTAAISLRFMRQPQPRPPVRAVRPRAPLVPDEEAPITEDEAHDILDEEEER